MNPKLLIFSAMGMELVGAVLGAVWLGRWLDDEYDLKGAGVLILSIAALVGWLIHIVVLLRRLERQEEETPKKDA